MRHTVIVSVAATILCGCGAVERDPAPAESTTAARSTSSEPGLQPPAQHNTNGRPDVVYDPCTWIPDSVFESVGYDPSTKRRDDLAAESTSFGCALLQPDRQLSLISDNYPFDERIERYRTSNIETTTINGRDAVLFPDDVEPYTCNVIMRTNAGAVLVARVIYAERETPCAGMVEFASVFERTIGPEN